MRLLLVLSLVWTAFEGSHANHQQPFSASSYTSGAVAWTPCGTLSSHALECGRLGAIGLCKPIRRDGFDFYSQTPGRPEEKEGFSIHEPWWPWCSRHRRPHENEST